MELEKIKGLDIVNKYLPESKTRLKNFLGNSSIKEDSDLNEIVSQWSFLNYYQTPKNEEINVTCDFDGHGLKNIFVIKNEKNGNLLTIGPDDFRWLTEIKGIMAFYLQANEITKKDIIEIKKQSKKTLKDKKHKLKEKFNKTFEEAWKNFMNFEKSSYAAIRKEVKNKYEQKYKEKYQKVIKDIKNIDFIQQARKLELNSINNKSILNKLFEFSKDKQINSAITNILEKIKTKTIDDFFKELSDSERELLFNTISNFQIYNKKTTFSSIIEDIKYLKEETKGNSLEILVNNNIKLLNFREVGEILNEIPIILEKRTIKNAFYSFKLEWKSILSDTYSFKSQLRHIYSLLFNETGKAIEISENLTKKLEGQKKELIKYFKIWNFNAKTPEETYLNSISLTNISKFKNLSKTIQHVDKILKEEIIFNKFKKQNPNIKIVDILPSFELAIYKLEKHINSSSKINFKLNKISEIGWKGKKSDIPQENYIKNNKSLIDILGKVIKKLKDKEYFKYRVTNNSKEITKLYSKIKENFLMKKDAQIKFQENLSYLLKAFDFIEKNKDTYQIDKYIKTSLDFKINWDFKENLKKESDYFTNLGYKPKKERTTWVRNKVVIEIKDIFSIAKYLKLKDYVENPKIKLKAIKNPKIVETLENSYY